MIQKNLISLLVAIILCIIGINLLYTQVKANFESNINNTTNTSNITISEVEKQTVAYKEKQLEITKLNEEIDKSNKQLRLLDQQRQNQGKELAVLSAESINLQRQNYENSSSINSETGGKNIGQDAINLIRAKFEANDKIISGKIKENNIKQENLIKANQEKETEIIATQNNIKLLEISLDNKKTGLIDQLNNIINTGLLLASNYALYLLILIALWLIYKFALRFIDSDLHNEQIKSASRKTVKIIWIIFSVLVVFYGFAGQFSYILASLGFVSAALVFALQNFVASFFVFVILSFTKIIKIGDIIKVGSTGEGYTGEVVSIGRFYTFIKEISPENQEELGRTVSVPNSFLLLHPITNFTVKNKVIWQTLKVIVKGDCDQVKAKKILLQILVEKFEWVKTDQNKYLGYSININELTPKLSMSLEERGVGYTLHFPCHFQKYNEIYDQLLTEVIHDFKEADIIIAFL